jgi:hypothetical protein
LSGLGGPPFGGFVFIFSSITGIRPTHLYVFDRIQEKKELNKNFKK